MKKTLYTLLALVTVLTVTTACQNYTSSAQKRKNQKPADYKRNDSWFGNDKIDPYGKLDREDYIGIGDNRKMEDFSTKAPKLKLPKLQDLIEEPEEPDLVDDRLVSISVNDNIPLKEVLIELSRRAEVDVEIDKDIEGSIIFIAKDKPFSEVIKRISDMANLRYSFDDGVLRIGKDKPYISSYKFNLLDITRSSNSSVNSSLSVGGSNSDSGSASVQSGSSSTLNIKSGDGDVWNTVEKGIETLISNFKASSPSSGEKDKEGDLESSIISVNKNAGMVSVLATKRQHEAIKKYLDSVHISLTSQVLIEAKVLEVTLSDKYNSGIDWNLITNQGGSGSFGIGSNFNGSALSAASLASGSLGLTNGFKFGVLPTNIFGNDNASLSASVELLETFGVTRSLSNPRISTMNNQFAVLNFSQNEVYFDVKLEREERDATTNSPEQSTVTVESEIKTVPIGIVLTLQPSIDLNRDEIMMSIRPTLTRVTNRVSNPGVTLIAKDLGVDTSTLNSDIPIVEVRELDTVLRSGSGEIMVIGGLLEERTINTDQGVPGMASIPYLGNAFKSVKKDTDMIETVIFLKATIIPGQGVSIEDENFYKKFNRPRTSFDID